MCRSRFIAALLACVLWLTGTAASAATALDAAFESGEIVFQKAEPELNFDEMEFVIPEGFWEAYGADFPEPSERALRAELAREWEDGDLMLSDISPDGKTILFLGGLAALRDGRLTLMCPNPERGVPDEYGNLDAFMRKAPDKRIGREGVVWSPDGRYFVFPDRVGATMDLSHPIAPILMDAETGDMILTAACSNNPNDRYGSMLSACFSPDGRSLYYMLRQWSSGPRISLMRYDIGTGNTELCLTLGEGRSCESFITLPDGSVLTFVFYAKNQTVPQADLDLFVEKDGVWSVEERELGLMLGRYELRSSPATGSAVLGLYRMRSIDSLLQIVRAEDFSGLDEYWYVDTEMHRLARVSADELQEEAEYSMLDPLLLSPDGRYLMMQYYSLRSRNMYAGWLCVRLSDMTAVPVRFEEPIRELEGSFSGRAVWTDAGLLFASSGKGLGFYTLAGE